VWFQAPHRCLKTNTSMSIAAWRLAALDIGATLLSAEDPINLKVNDTPPDMAKI